MFVQRLLARHFPLRLSLFYFFLLLLIEKISNSFLIMSRNEFVERRNFCAILFPRISNVTLERMKGERFLNRGILEESKIR